MTLNDKVHASWLHVLRRAKELGNVSAACREAGVSHTLFYRWRKRFLLYGPDGLHPRQTGAQRGRPPQLAVTDERRIVATALANPTWGPQRMALQFAQEGFHVSSTTVWRALRRAGLLTERTRRSLSRSRTRHVQADEPGELVCIDTFYIGKLKGVGKLWQITACDAASSYALAKVVAVCNASEAAAFLKQVVAPTLAEAGWRLQRVLTDGGSEFRGEFDRVCEELNVRHTRTKPRHAWTNGFVERLQGTILHEHWRIAFRRRYFRKRFQLQASLDGFLRFYNFERPHQGYRTKGRIPAEIFWGAVSHAIRQEV